MFDDATTLARFAGLLADRTRMGICLALFDGRAWTSGELARHTSVTASSISEQITKLVGAGLLTEHRLGRYRYVSLAGPDIATFIEDLATLSGTSMRPPTSLRSVRQAGELAAARTCYDHLAGELGVALLDGLVGNGHLRIDGGLAITPAGYEWFDSLGCSLTSSTRRPVIRSCLDWTERRPHLAGVAGSSLRAVAVDRGWVVPRRNQRAVTVTRQGAEAFRRLLGIDLGASAKVRSAS